MRKKKAKPFWERAYKGHAYWLGKMKLGKVTLIGKQQYAWEAAGRPALPLDAPSAPQRRRR